METVLWATAAYGLFVLGYVLGHTARGWKEQNREG